MKGDLAVTTKLRRVAFHSGVVGGGGGGGGVSAYKKVKCPNPTG